MDILRGRKFDVVVGDALAVLRSFPSDTFHCCVTSPPYWKLRDYKVAGQMGLEGTPEEYVAGMVGVFREVRRVLRPEGTFWLNIGDCYQDKNLVGIPWLLAFALRADGWWLRGEQIWWKGNAMADSTRDRPGRQHEQVFLLAKAARYFFDMEAVKEPVADATKKDRRVGTDRHGDFDRKMEEYGNAARSRRCARNAVGGDETRNLRSVWKIPVKGWKGAHFAVMPTALAELCIKAGTSERGCCPSCGAPWVRQVKRVRRATRPGKTTKVTGTSAAQHGNRDPGRHVTSTETIGWQASCNCPPADPVPCLVLDPFAGACTTLLAATRLGRRALGIELSADYAAMGLRRVEEELAKPVKTVRPRRPRQPAGEPSLFDNVGDLQP